MTGRELILYILQNHLEDQQIFANGKFLDFMTVKEAAVKFEVGETTVRVWVKMNMIPYISMGDEIFIPNTAPNPKTKETSYCRRDSSKCFLTIWGIGLHGRDIETR